jgi:hypothetical protein
LSFISPPSLASYNERATARRLTTGSGAALVFVPPDDLELGYEQRAYERGEIVTRPDNWHDAYNAEVWLEFPLSKAQLNLRHRQAMAGEADGKRGRLRDRLTQFDECGIVITGMRQRLWQALCVHRWREVFVTHREEVIATTRFHVFGHASRDSLRAPFFGLCGKAIWLEGEFNSAESLDAALACRLTATDFRAPFQPLPLLGIPGITPENKDPAYYDDERQFRPARTICAGSSLGNR